MVKSRDRLPSDAVGVGVVGSGFIADTHSRPAGASA